MTLDVDEIRDGAQLAADKAVARGHPRSPAQPRFCTPRTPSRATLGPEVVEVMRMLGFEPMLWQIRLLDVAMELDADGDLVYREVVVVVPRQSGKTVLLLALRVWRALRGAQLWGQKQTTIYTAQTRNDARKKFLDDQLPMLKESEFAPLFRERLALGSEGLVWRNGSIFSIEPTTKKAGHGKTVDQAEIDEAFALEDDRVQQGLGPAMSTRRSPQTWIVSAVGDDSDEKSKVHSSAWLKEKMAVGQALVALQLEDEAVRSVACYCEYSAAPGEDPDDPETWWGCMPALGEPGCGWPYTQTVKAIAADRQLMKPEAFERAYLCRWPGARQHVRIIDLETWRSPRHLELAPLAPAAQFVGRTVLAVDASPGLRSVGLVLAGRRPDGRPQLEVIVHDLGSTWAPEAVAVFAKAHRPTVVMGSKSPAAALLPDLQLRKVDVELGSMDDVCRGAEMFMQLFTEGDAMHLGQAPLDAAVDVAIKRPIGERFAFSRVDVEGDICTLVAGSLALWFLHQPPKRKEYGWYFR